MATKQLFFLLSIIFLFGCKKKNDPPPSDSSNATEVKLTVGYKVDSAELLLNLFNYKVQAGYSYSVTKLEYYLSQISLIRADSSSVLLTDYNYFNYAIASTNNLSMKKLPAGNYIGLKFNIGLDSVRNISFSLPATNENIGMQWPDMMGGGYHFLKLEGQFKDSTGTHGYAMHTGTSKCLIPIKIFKPIVISEGGKTTIDLIMNINEWYRNPNVFDFNKDGNYIMGNMNGMKKIVENGVDVFTF